METSHNNKISSQNNLPDTPTSQPEACAKRSWQKPVLTKSNVSHNTRFGAANNADGGNTAS